MTMKVNERDSPVSRAGETRSVKVMKPIAAWILVLLMIAMLLVPLVGYDQVVPSGERPSQQETVRQDRQTPGGLSAEELIPLLSPHLGHSGQ